MDVDEDDDFYAPDEAETTKAPAAAPAVAPKVEQHEDLEEGEEEDEGGAMDEDEDDSDIDIITDRKDGIKAAPPSNSKYSEIRNIPQRNASSDGTSRAAPVKIEGTKSQTPQISASQVDINAIPTHKGTGKPLTQVNIDEDLPDNDKPWRTPGTDLSDYFNYGFDEFTWTLYAQKQEDLRGEYNQGAITQSQKKMMEDMNSMMIMGGMPGMSMPGMPGGAGGSGSGAAGAAPIPGMGEMPPEMQAMMQQMMGSGMDPSHLDPSAMAAMFAGMQGGAAAGGQGGQGGQGQNFGGAGGGGFGGGQGPGYGYDQQGHGNQGRGGFQGRGRGGRRNW